MQVWALNTTDGLLARPDQVTWTVCTMMANFAICFLGWWRCFANNYLHWAAGTTWLLLITQGNGSALFCLSFFDFLSLFLFFSVAYVCFSPPSVSPFLVMSSLSVSSVLVFSLPFPALFVKGRLPSRGAATLHLHVHTCELL